MSDTKKTTEYLPPHWWLAWGGSGRQLNCQYVLYLQTSIIQSTKQHQRRVRRISCLAEKIWQMYNQCTWLCCSSHKCMFLTNMAPFKRQILVGALYIPPVPTQMTIYQKPVNTASLLVVCKPACSCFTAFIRCQNYKYCSDALLVSV